LKKRRRRRRGRRGKKVKEKVGFAAALIVLLGAHASKRPPDDKSCRKGGYREPRNENVGFCNVSSGEFGVLNRYQASSDDRGLVITELRPAAATHRSPAVCSAPLQQ
jgi:hypothetical protein